MSKVDYPSAEAISQDMLQCMSEALIVSDLEGILRIWNPGSENVFGFTAAEDIGQSLDLVIPERMRKAHWDGFNKAVAREAAHCPAEPR